MDRGHVRAVRDDLGPLLIPRDPLTGEFNGSRLGMEWIWNGFWLGHQQPPTELYRRSAASVKIRGHVRKNGLEHYLARFARTLASSATSKSRRPFLLTTDH
jgi:hypothetical protein